MSGLSIIPLSHVSTLIITFQQVQKGLMKIIIFIFCHCSAVVTCMLDYFLQCEPSFLWMLSIKSKIINVLVNKGRFTIAYSGNKFAYK